MIFDLDLTKPVEPSQNPLILRSLLGTLLGQRCLKVDLSYGDELMLHVGEPISYQHPNLAAEKKGAWILGTRASAWQLLLNQEPPSVIESDEFPARLTAEWRLEGNGHRVRGEEVEGLARNLAGETITSARPVPFPVPPPLTKGVGLVVEFTGGSRLVVVPSSEPVEEDEPLADWELFTPYRTYLRVGPGLVWAYLCSNEPAQAPAKTP